MRRITRAVMESLIFGLTFGLTAFVIELVRSSLFGSHHQDWSLVIGMTIVGISMPWMAAFTRRFPIWPDRSGHKRRLQELKDKRERLAQSRTTTG